MRENETETPTMVCVHGAGGGGWEWAIWARVLAAQGWSVVAPDLRPVAEGIERTRYADYRAQVVDWCRSVEGPVVLAGASLGGSLALAAAIDADVQALVLVNPLVPRSLPAAPRPSLIPWGRRRSLAGTRRAMHDADDAACLYALRRWRDESGAVLDEAEAVSLAPGPAAVPTLVLAGALDEDTPPALSRALAIRLDADFECLPDTGHVGPLLGRGAADVAGRAAGWLRSRRNFPALCERAGLAG